MSDLTIKIPRQFKHLGEKGPRYKIVYGGRGGKKSWSFIRAALARAASEKTRILCCREVQRSIKESVHHLIVEQIAMLGMSDYFVVTDNSIQCSNGSEFIFYGLYRNQAAIKSLEGVDICIVFEAQSVSDTSWDYLTPTIRKDNSEIWIEFNPDNEDDPTYKRYVVSPPQDSIVKLINFCDTANVPKAIQEEYDLDISKYPVESAYIQNKWYGKPLGVGRKIWTAFDESVHIREFPWDLVRDNGNCFCAMDPHSHYYPFIVWVAVIPKNKRGNWPEDYYRWVYNEWPTVDDLGDYYHECRKKVQFTGSLKDVSTAIYNRDYTGQYGLKINKRFIDSRYAKGSGSWSWSSSTTGIVDLFSKPENGGLLFDLPSEKTIDSQREQIHSDMLYNLQVERSMYNEPSFYVAPWCRNTIVSLKNHRLVQDGDQEDEKYKEPSDCLRICYAGIQDYGYKPAVPKIVERQRDIPTAVPYLARSSGTGWMGV